MPRNDGRIVVISDFGPGKLLRIAEDIAIESQCRLEDLRGKRREGFHIYDAAGTPPIYTIATLIASSAGALRVPLDIEVYANRTQRDDGRIILAWVETGSALRPSVCRIFVHSLADELEARIEHAGGRVLESYDD
jgi:hypothetical protein